MKRMAKGLLWLSITVALLCSVAMATSDVGAWGIIQDRNAILCLPGASKDGAFECQVGTAKAEVGSVKALGGQETPVETIVVLDNSFSIKKDERPRVTEILEDLIANRMEGETYSIATVSDTVSWLCQEGSDYASLKSAIEGLQYHDQNTQLTDGLYQILTERYQAGGDTFRRVLIVADGVDNKQVGYTRDELNELIRRTGYPIYAVGCTNTTKNGTEELQNLFSLARVNTGSYFQLKDVQDSMEIVKAVTEWNNAVRVEIPLPNEACDGGEKTIRVTQEGGSSYAVQLTMPLGEVQEPAPEPEPEPEPPAPQPEPEVPEEPEESGFPVWGIVLIIVAVLAVVIIIVVILLVRRKNKKEAFVEVDTPAPDASSGTEMVDADTDSATAMIWSDCRRLILQDQSDRSRRYEVELRGDIVVGRDASACQIVIGYDNSLSRQQCRIYERSGRVMLSNLSKSNITQVNGRVVSSDCEIGSGTVIRMGRVTMLVEIT